MKDNDNHYSKTYGKYSWKPNIYTIFANKKSSYRLWTHDNIIYIIGPKWKPKWNTLQDRAQPEKFSPHGKAQQ